MMRARRLATASFAIIAGAMFVAGPASAHLVRPVSSFTPAGLEGAMNGVAVDNSGGAFNGDVYVAEQEPSPGKLERFSATGVRDTSFAPTAVEIPGAVAVDNSVGASKGDVYVAEPGASTVIKLDSSGEVVAGFTPITTSSFPPGSPGSEHFTPGTIAIDPSNGNVVVGDTDGGGVTIFSSSGVFIAHFKAVAYGIVVGPNSEIYTMAPGGAREWSPSDGYSTPTIVSHATGYAIGMDLATGVLFTDENEAGRVTEYEVSKTEPLQFTELGRFGSGLLGEASDGAAVNEATDTVYVPVEGTMYIFGAPAAIAEVLTGSPATGVTGTAAEVSGSVNPEGVTVTACRFEYGLSTSYGSTAPCSVAAPLTGNAAIQEAASLEALQPNETYHYRLAAVSAEGTAYDADQTFQTAALEPSLDNQSVSALTQTSATLNASINPNNQETTYHFEYGTAATYGTVLPASDVGIGSGYGDVIVGQELSGLTPGTTYYFRVVATNATSPPGGTTGADQTFTTPPLQPPVVATGQASGVTQTSATLTGTIDTQGFATVYEFDFGVDTSYGSRIFGDAGVTPGTQTFTAMLQGLTPGTTYHYRILATNTFGTVYGVDGTFTTPSVPAAVLVAPPAAPLIATEVVTFPTQARTTTTTTKTLKCKRGFVKRKNRCVKKPKKKPSARKAGRERRTKP
jgi:hypothetical protein